ncbi:hypothetical protein A2Z00_01935 [Candidatus Gottesmanbacteria bacterium RBG_13_45_10]|uniref:Uncharacterized protein n=1 Tax=Candidatus Gottesmanbacteria bacterium RBG_13_45_10 TaxID=1798370 RepID=A0A1F5ZHJ2_9BACT|nr:MAG: hypothetical protein A2Z00_01935 [Candidatus Gottesmanbacteria bacterium RBG_13_45_10]
MHRNTYIVVILLAVFAALVVGVNLGKRFSSPAPSSETPTPVVTTQANPTPTATPAATLVPYTNQTCAITFQYPSSLGIINPATSAAVLTDPANGGNTLAIACQKDIPRIPLPEEKIETRIIPNSTNASSVSAKLYHSASAKDGLPMDALIFRNPKIRMDIFISGFGDSFNQIIRSLRIL